MRLIRPPRWFQGLFPRYTWRFSVSDNTIFLTFDDGPHPEITPFVLDLLKEYNWKATFFCVGANMERYPELVERIVNEGHTIGNHSFNHEKGWTTHFKDYISSFKQFEEMYSTKFFRPPYGRMTKHQAKEIYKTHQIILWSWLSYDYDLTYPNEKILENLEQVKSGDVLVFHDNPKIAERNSQLLPLVFRKLQENFTSKKL